MRFKKKVEKLGSGVSGVVDLYKGKDYYVVKTYHSKEKHETTKEYICRVKQEYNILVRSKHPNLILVYKFRINWRKSGQLYLEHGGVLSLKDIIDQFKPTNDELLCLFKQLVNGVNYLHHMNCCHRDLKLENLLIGSDGYLKIIDLADAKDLSDSDTAYGIIGTERYVAPEVFNSLKYNGYKIDIWSMGIILYYLLFNTCPWKVAKIEDPKYSLFLNDYQIIFNHESNTICEFVLKLINPDYNQRWDTTQLLHEDWFSNINSCLNSSCSFNHKRLHLKQRNI